MAAVEFATVVAPLLQSPIAAGRQDAVAGGDADEAKTSKEANPPLPPPPPPPPPRSCHRRRPEPLVDSKTKKRTVGFSRACLRDGKSSRHCVEVESTP